MGSYRSIWWTTRTQFRSDWTVQQARNLAINLGQRLEDIRFSIRDPGPNFTHSSDAIFQATGTTILRRPPQMNAIRERLASTLRRESPRPNPDPR
jgi:putative transposase